MSNDFIAKISCKCCGKHPKDILEYKMAAEEEGYGTPEAYVWANEGTLNKKTGLFYCTDCYIKLGCPIGTA